MPSVCYRLPTISKRPIYHCQCGCEQRIPWRPSHLTRPPRYILQHYLKLGTSHRITKLREAKLLARLPPPSDWITPSGVCECGCGQHTTIAKTSSAKRNEYAGYPHRWIHGHYGRALLSKRGPEHPQWSGGRIAGKDGYVLIYLPEYPNAPKSGYMPEHRYIYETTRGVTLPSSVHVHHLNGDRGDNRPENLVASARSDHMRTHKLANALASLLLDDRLHVAAKAHVLTHGSLPDLATLTQQVYGS